MLYSSKVPLLKGGETFCAGMTGEYFFYNININYYENSILRRLQGS